MNGAKLRAVWDVFAPTKGITKLLARSQARCHCEPSASPSRRDTPIVAWHEVPGKASSKEPSRRVRYDRAQLIPVSDVVRVAGQWDGPFPEAARYRDGDGSETLPRHLGIVPFF